ncbi:SusC/RagA family TonB-linked outer membrane protein [Duncaniella muricolitica]|uniref:SusC/RagA family TonB-linked outer membrane protein n=1 Tax=Duncaniella muricolitica TaxID=2880704 RepID=UPI00244E0CA5|nr:TonB-dependent receptor [Duncaniella muricolitica]
MKQVSILAVAFVIGLNAYATTLTDTIATQTTGRIIAHKAISGTVTDRKGQPVIGATVKVKEDVRKNAVTDIEGNFKISDIPDSCTLQVSYIGFMPMETKVTPDKSEYSITMRVNHSVLDEVVVVGYATQKKVDLTGAVSSVSVDALEDRPITNATNALAGLAAGLTVTNSGGNTPGFEAQSILVRGQGTLNNAAPLVVVDGMTGIALSDINPQDIENISVLKDAASAAIYGSRAANGVILVTTRHGSERAPRVTYSGNISFETVAKRLNLVTDYADFMEIQNAGLVANGQAPRFSQGKIDEWRNDAGRNPTVYPNTDWQDHIYRNPSVVQNHNLSVTGGSKTVKYNISLGYVNNPGMIYYTDYKRYQLRSNIDVNIKPWLSVGTNLFGYIDENNPSSENAAAGGDVIFGSGAFNTVPGMTLYDPATGLYGGIQNPEEENVSNFNPYRRQWFYDTDYPTKTKRSVMKLYARLMPVKGLTIQGSFSYNHWERNVEHHLTDRDLFRFTFDGPVLIREGVVRTYIRRYNYKNTFRSSELTARYKFNVSKLGIDLFAGMSQEYNKYDQDYYIKYDLVDPSLGAIDAGMTNGSITGNYNEWAMRSYFGRVNLNWDNRYLLEANLRADGSSKFAPGHRWGYFPSVSAGWRISEEKFMQNTSSWLNQLKLRASYGSLGNNATTSYYMYQSLFATANYILNGNIAGGLAQTVLANPSLTWEKTYMTNIGLDFAFLNNRLSGSVDIYNKDTKGILISLPAPLEHGTSVVPNQNAGEVNNKGFELDLRWNDRIGKVSYNVGFNMGFVSNKVTKFQGDVSSISGVYKTQEGKPINQLYVITVDRIVRDQSDLDYVQSLVDKNPDYFATYQRPELGDFLYRDANGDGKLDTNDRVEIGYGTLPRLTYGANLGLAWNGFDFSVLFQGVGNHQVYYNNQAFRFVTVMGQSLIKDITDNAWTPENPYKSKYPMLRNNANGKNNIASDAFVHNAAYFRCKNIQLGYTVPKKITKNFFVENLKVYASIDNLFTITDFPGFDPEVGANVGYPSVRQYSVGLNVSF